MKKYQQLYVKYLIKNPVLYYGFMGLFLVVFLFMSLNIKLDNIKTYNASINGNIISVDGRIDDLKTGNEFYYYTSKSEKVYHAEAIYISNNNNILNITIDSNEQDDVSGVTGVISVDIIVGKQTLLERIFVKAGKN